MLLFILSILPPSFDLLEPHEQLCWFGKRRAAAGLETICSVPTAASCWENSAGCSQGSLVPQGSLQNRKYECRNNRTVVFSLLHLLFCYNFYSSLSSFYLTDLLSFFPHTFLVYFKSVSSKIGYFRGKKKRKEQMLFTNLLLGKIFATEKSQFSFNYSQIP